MSEYIHHPHRKDTLCRRELRKAETDIGNGELRIVQFGGFMSGTPRHEREFRQLCTEIGMPVYYHSAVCVSIENQQHGCYAYRMNAEIIKRFGTDFTDSLVQAADIRFIQNHLADTLSIYDCTVMAAPENTPDFDRKHFSISVDNELADILSYYETGKPNMIVEFIVNTAGELSLPAVSKELPLYNYPKDQEAALLQLCHAALLQTGKWTPSRLGENDVNSRVLIAVFFEPLP